jgi:flagellar hook protein FlgE
MVSTSLFTGLSGLRSHQRWMDVIGNNLANVNTSGFWGSRVTFSDLLSFTMSPGNGPSGTAGGRNPMQVGLGTQVGGIDANTNQGTFLNTGRPLDVALQGQGFFTLTDGVRNYYSRVGSFGVDSDRNLIDTRTGMRVVNDSGGTIDVPLTGTLPAQASSQIDFEGTLPATVNGPIAEVVSSTAPWYEGTAAAKSSTASLPDPMDLSAHDGDTFTITVNGGSPQTVTINAANFGNLTNITSVEWIDGIEKQVNGISASYDAGSGFYTYTTERVGELATIKFDNGSGVTPLTTLGIDTDLIQGTQSAATAATSLNDLTVNNTDYSAGDTIAISGTDPSGNKVASTFTFGSGAGQDGETVGDLITFLNDRFSSGTATGATASIDNSGTLSLTANSKGESNLSLFISDATSTTRSNYASFKVTRDGTGPDEAVTSIDIVDSLGRSHPVSMTFVRDSNDPTVWNLTASMDSSEGTILDGAVSEIRFNADGSFNLVTDTNQTLSFEWNGIATTQTVALDFGTSAGFDGVSMLGESATVAATNQGGYPAGSLLEVAFNENGDLQGFYTNGKSINIDTLRIALFRNPAGVTRVGETLFTESPNTDDAILTTAQNGGAGSVISGVLENSNVDIAEEFVRLIEAQRGYQANARVITTTDQILSELMNIVR